SWYRNGYPTLMPFESDTQRMNSSIHTSNDVISNRVSFRHSLIFAKIALVFAMDLGNNQMKQPY
ncbi:MAG TPA: aminopeptidase, partial [Pseudobdellovibrionaceae bacterium]|nr:aminopeptidase [Pseudobdellovibrionaceae bacterium]